jgi:hypothetical protein
MAIYPIIHKETGEKRVVEMSVHDIQEWYNNNPDWKRDWSQGCAAAAEVGEWKDKLNKKYPGWNDVLGKVSKSAGSKSQISKI